MKLGPVTIGRLTIDAELRAFVESEALPGTGIESAGFWTGLEQIIAEFTPRNRALLAAARRTAGRHRCVVARTQGPAV